MTHARDLPDVAKIWYESGPKTAMDAIASFLVKENKRGRLRVPNPARAARLFAGMIVFDDNLKRSVCLPKATRSELARVVAEAVKIFLAAYGR